jgi:glycerophosphoryl diester phosphodiesterase
MHWRDWTPHLVAATHDAGLRAFGWDAQTEVAVERLLGIGIDALYADHPDRLVARVRSTGERSRRGT